MENLTGAEKDTLKLLPTVITVLETLSPNAKVGPAIQEYLVSELKKLQEGLEYLSKNRDHQPK